MSADVFERFASRYDRIREEEYSLKEYLELCRQDSLTYASAAERMLMAICQRRLKSDPLSSESSE